LSLWRVAYGLNYINGGLFHQINVFYFHGNLLEKNKVMPLLEFVVKIMRMNPVVAGWIKFTDSDYTNTIEPVINHSLNYLENQLKIFESLENLEERQQISQLEYIASQFKSLFAAGKPGVPESDWKFVEFPPNFKMADFPVNVIKDVPRTFQPFQILQTITLPKLPQQLKSGTGTPPSPITSPASSPEHSLATSTNDVPPPSSTPTTQTTSVSSVLADFQEISLGDDDVALHLAALGIDKTEIPKQELPEKNSRDLNDDV